jgi:hypothetical protein
MNGSFKDAIAACRIEAAKFRRLAALHRKAARNARERRDWIAAMHASGRAGEYTLSAGRCDRQADVLRAEAGLPQSAKLRRADEKTARMLAKVRAELGKVQS